MPVDQGADHNSEGAFHQPEELAEEIVQELKQEGISLPSWWWQIFPWAATAFILWWIFRDLPFQSFLKEFQKARLELLLPALFGYALVFAVADILSFGLCYRWFAAPDLSWREMFRVRWGTYLFQALYSPLTTVAVLAYLIRKKGVPASWVISAAGFAALNDLLIVNLVMSAAIVLNRVYGVAQEPGLYWLAALAPGWILAYLHFRYWFTDAKDRWFPRFRNHPLLRSSRLGRPRHYAWVYLMRLIVALSGIAAHGLALHAFGIQAPWPVVFVVAPLVIGGVFLPISGGGLGGPQLFALILLPYAGGDAAAITAYSISFSISFTLGRCAIGAFFLPGFLKDLREKRPRLTRDPLTGEPI